MKRIAADLFYFPNLEFFCSILGYDELVFDPSQIFRRNSYLNRTEILGPNKVLRLSVPIQGRRPRLPEAELRIGEEQNWALAHVRSIQTAYGKAPFFEYYFPFFEQIFASAHTSIWELNMEIMTLCLRLLTIPAKIVPMENIDPKWVDRDIRGELGTQEPFSSRDYYSPYGYFQVFGVDFEPNLGVLDLLFNVGPESRLILERSVKKH